MIHSVIVLLHIGCVTAMNTPVHTLSYLDFLLNIFPCSLYFLLIFDEYIMYHSLCVCIYMPAFVNKVLLEHSRPRPCVRLRSAVTSVLPAAEQQSRDRDGEACKASTTHFLDLHRKSLLGPEFRVIIGTWNIFARIIFYALAN